MGNRGGVEERGFEGGVREATQMHGAERELGPIFIARDSALHVCGWVRGEAERCGIGEPGDVNSFLLKN